MKNDIYIDKRRELSKAQDYEYLKNQGMIYIESLANKLWTEYNAPDPGITIMEILCYVITELGYRNAFDIEDLLTDSKGDIKNETFFPAKQILTNAPLTVLDYRKLLIDVPGINNAWIITHNVEMNGQGYWNPLDNEVSIYINPKEDKLSFLDQDKFGNDLNILPIRGLNQVILDLSEDIELGHLNDVSVEFSWLDSERFIQVEITTEYSSWHHSNIKWFALMNEASEIQIRNIEKDGFAIKVVLERIADTSQDIAIFIHSNDPSDIEIAYNHFNNKENLVLIIDTLKRKKEKVDLILEIVSKILNSNRNLTEDWLCLDTISTIDIGVCADIHIEANADAEALLAEVEMTIDLLFNPSIRFYTLKQMLDLGFNARQIFTGPSLKHGFLLNDEVINARLPDCIHVSDIIAALVAIKGVKSVDNALITAYDSMGNPISSKSNQSWCLSLNGQIKPVLETRKSKLLLFREGIPFIIPQKGKYELFEGINYLKVENDTYKLQDPDDDFKFPSGTHYQIDTYYSIQNDFPTTYQIGKGQLRDTATPARKAKAKQLKAYLLHFDQILIDFFKQLYHAKDLFAINQVESGLPNDKTYFHSYLKDIPGIDASHFWNEIYVDSYKEQIGLDPTMALRSHYEDDALFYDRRNRFLDHLMSRFNESFNDYVFMQYKMQENASGVAELVLQKDEIIKDKQNFLIKYPELSYQRGLGLNVVQPKSDEFPWKIEFRGGYEKRIAALLGINNLILDDIVDNQIATTWSYDTELGILEFSLQNFVTMPLNEKWELAQMLINNVSAYRVFTFSKSYIYFVNEDNKRIVKLNKEFETALKAQNYIPQLYQALNSYFENFYCIEHILLRPLISENLTDDDLLSVCLKDDCISEASNDPYSFKITMVLPGWLGRFRNRYFRRYAENLIRNEAPAHVLVKICWVGRDDLKKFQNTYKKWLLEFCKIRMVFCSNSLDEQIKLRYNRALSKLVEHLKELNSIYDEGTLHDCLESELDNPISLNNSSLGTLKNIEP